VATGSIGSRTDVATRQSLVARDARGLVATRGLDKMLVSLGLVLVCDRRDYLIPLRLPPALMARVMDGGKQPPFLISTLGLLR
jgi:hypothetical protein